ncbi:MAG: hypothetical protein CVV27_15970 [Candidatus Melainabacteria bacterium HGW-Melainabacteria-1]|nr:MAG: hypothetical protein CVV27_15970 [Candidatus Melainabacteria bacterium HGW-Melainabacteria-1]
MKRIPSRLLRSLCGSLALSCLLLPLSQAASAVTLTYSDKTQKVAPFFDFRGSYDLPFNLNVNGYLGFAPDLSSFISPFPSAAGSGDVLKDQISNWARWDTLADLNLNIGYRFQLFDVVGLNGSIMPYLGYRHMFTFTGNFDGNQVTPTNSQAQGIHYGARFNLGLPLGFSGFAYAEASSLVGGSFEQSGTTTAMMTNGVTLPGYGVGINWQLPFINLASAYAGYRGFFLPTDLRLDANLNEGVTLVHGLSLGANFLFFGI